MLFSETWKLEEDNISEKIIKDTIDIINFDKRVNIQNQLCIKYISVYDENKTFRYLIFIPFIELTELNNNYEEYNKFPYIFIKNFKSVVSDDFMKWIFFTTRANKIPVIIGKIDCDISGAWNICYGDKRISYTQLNNYEEEFDIISFDRWLFEKKTIDKNFKILIKNPLISKLPFIQEQNILICFKF